MTVVTVLFRYFKFNIRETDSSLLNLSFCLPSYDVYCMFHNHIVRCPYPRHETTLLIDQFPSDPTTLPQPRLIAIFWGNFKLFTQAFDRS